MIRHPVRTSTLLAAGLAAAAAATFLTTTPATSAPARHHPAAGPPPRPVAVTLVTGDRVLLTGDRAAVTPGPGRARMTFEEHRDGHRHVSVIPTDALPLLAAGRLDRRLFDVTALAAQGFTDDKVTALPLLVGHAPGVAAPAAARAGGTAVTRELPRLGLTAVAEPHGRAGEFWRSVRGPAGSPARALAGGVTRIWLDGRVRASLDQSVPQIGAPQVWAGGNRGAGVTVAVLDSGYALDHPDLAGAVTASRGFTDAGPADVADRFGHGTHVASIVAGRGTASAGRFTGVAPQADLAVGKVLGDDGSGLDDWIIAGMQWAAVDEHARVVNLSLGGAPSDGTDPVSQAIDQLTAQTGALFVVAAGNEGADRTVEAPGAADAALTVGSVTKQDALSDFSSRGPRLGDDAVKPDLVAPGTDIVAARAAGTPVGDVDPVGDAYVRLSGTSMATPHVAGAAALLAHQHPDWRADQLKAALLSSAAVLPDLPVYAQGAGRLDVAAAARQTVHASTGSLSLGRLAWPFAADPDRRSEVTFRNDGTAAVTLDLALDLADQAGNAAPAGMVTLAPATLRVPAGGTATAALTLSPRAAVPGLYGGRLTATPSGGGAALHLTVGASVEAEAYDLTVHAIARTGGSPGPTDLLVERTDGPGGAFDLFAEDGTGTLRLPRGTYAVLGFLREPAPPGEFSPATAVARTGVALTAPTTVTLDGRGARPVRVAVDEPSARVQASGQSMTLTASGDGVTFLGDPALPAYAPALPAPGLRYTLASTLARPDVTLSLPGSGEVPVAWPSIVRPLPFDRTLRIVDAGQGTPADLARVDVRGALALVRPFEDLTTSPPDQVAALAAAGAAAVVVAPFDAGFSWQARSLPVPAVVTDHAGFARLAAAAGTPARLVTGGASPFAYHLVNIATDRLPGGTTFRVRTAALARVDADYRSYAGRGQAFELANQVDADDFGFGSITVDLPMRRTEFYSGGTWRTEVAPGPTPFFTGENEQRSYAAGRAYRSVWGVAVVAPALPPLDFGRGLPPQPAVGRAGDELFADIATLSEPVDGRSGFADLFGTGDTGDLTLSRDGADVGPASGDPNGGGWTLPADPGTYQLHQTAARTWPGWNLSTALDTTWTFRSGHAGDDPVSLPLLQVRYLVPLDGHNAMPAARPLPFRLDVTRQAGAGPADVAAVGCEASFDGGATWHRLAVAHLGAQWLVAPPVGGRAGGTVSLRVTARDTEGNAVRQTVANAFALR